MKKLLLGEVSYASEYGERLFFCQLDVPVAGFLIVEFTGWSRAQSLYVRGVHETFVGKPLSDITNVVSMSWSMNEGDLASFSWIFSLHVYSG